MFLPGLIALLAPALAAAAPTDLRQKVEARLAEAGPGTRFGLVVSTLDGQELLAIAPEQRFIPASNTKIFTTAAAFAILPGLTGPDAQAGARVLIEGNGAAADVVLEGRGDARLSSAPDCVTNCLAALADAVAAKTRRVRNIVGDARFFPDERWSQGMSWNNIPTGYGTALSALTLDDNEVPLRVFATEPGKPPRTEVSDYVRVENHALTVAEGETELEVERLPGTSLVRLTGTITAAAEPEIVRLGVDDPAHHAAWRFRRLLEARGVRITGSIGSRYRPAGAVAAPSGDALASLTPAPLVDDIRTINKVSQNLHTELLLRRVAAARGQGTAKDGIAAIRSMLDQAGVAPTAVTLADGSGMSTYNRTSPRGMVALLRWIARQPWGGDWRATLPVGGIDGTLRRRFLEAPLRGRLFAKTGTLNATNALAGYMLTRSGRTLAFAIYANDVPEEVRATRVMDGALELIAEAD